MALFTDGPISSIEDLRGHDSQLLDVANVEGIDVTRKLAQAQEELAIDVAVLFETLRTTASWLHTTGAGNVVVTAPLKLWHTFRALELVYRDAFNSQLNDRYAGKRDEYREMAHWARERVIQSGLGMTADPLPQAKTPVVTATAGALADGTYYAAAAWVGSKGTEGSPSVAAKISVTGSSFRVVSVEAPMNAVGWNVYVGSSPQTMFRQNDAVVALGAAWAQGDALAAVKLAGTGQVAEYVQGLPRVLQRG